MHADSRFHSAFALAVAAVVKGSLFACLAFLLVPRPATAADTAGAGPAPATAAPRKAEQAAEREASSADFEQRHETEFFRHLAGGEIDAARVRRMWAESKAMPSEPAAALNATNTWQLAGPVFSINPGGGFVTGRVRDIDPIHVRALAATGGLWRFDIFGGIPMCDSVPANWFGSFATSPLDANVILLGTGEYHKGVGNGMYTTMDGGATWTRRFMTPESPWFSRVRWAPDGSAAYAASDSGFYRSTDGGQTWARRLLAPVSDFTVVPGVPGLILAAQPGQGLLESTNGGVDWMQLLGSGVPYGVGGFGAISGVLDNSTGHVCICAAFDTLIWRSTNNGVTWTNVTPTNFRIGNSGYGPAISICPADPNTVLYGNVPFLRTTDGGAHWTKFADPNLHADVHVFAWDVDGLGVWMGHDGGWSHSLDKGATWSSSSNAMPISQFYSIDCEKTELGYMIGGTQDNNVLYTPSPALDWVDPALSSTEGDATGAVIDLYNPSQMWAVSGETNGPISYPRYHTTDGGTTWTVVDNGIDANVAGGKLRSDAAFNPWLYTSTDFYVYESQDAGATWNKTNPGAPFPAAIHSLTSSFRLNPSALLYVTLESSLTGQRVYVRDGGNWFERDGGLPAGDVNKVVPHPWSGNYADEAWAIMGSNYGARLYHTLDRGVTWANVSGDLPGSTAVSDLLPNPRHPGEWYVGTMLGCYRTTNGGVNWEHWNNGMPPAAIVTEMSYIDLTSTTGQFFVVAATYGRSVWKRDVAGDDVFPSLTVSDAYAQEGAAGQDTAWFRVQLSQKQSLPVTVDYATRDSTATLADNDYVATSGTLTFPAGETVQWIGVPVNGDTQIEADETFDLALSNPLRAAIANGGVGTILDDDSNGLTCSGLYVTDAPVYAVAAVGNTVYVGGTFARVGAPSGCAVLLDSATGLPVTLPKVDGVIMTSISDGSGGWYFGGMFRHVGGQPRTNLAHLRADGSLDAWNPVANGPVVALAAVGNAVYAGGSFTSVGGVPRPYLAAISPVTGRPLEWFPQPNAPVSALLCSGVVLYAGGSFTSIGGQPRSHAGAVYFSGSALATGWAPNANADVGTLMLDGGLVYAGGSFTTIGGQLRSYVAALDPATGAATAWNPGADNLVFTLAADAGAIYAGGAFTVIGGQSRPNLAALGRATGAATAWAPNADGTVNALAVGGGLVYVGGTFANIGGQARNNLAVVSATTGLASGWNPDPDATVSALGVYGSTVFAGGTFTCFAPQPRAALAAFDAVSGRLLPWNPGSNGSVLALAASGGTVYAGGSFTTIGGQPRNRIAALDSVSGLASAWDPNANNTVRTLLVNGTRILAGGNFTSIGGAARGRIAALATGTGLATTWNPNASGAVYAIATDGTSFYAGGSFASIGGQARSGLALLNGTTGAASATWNPAPNGTVYSLLVNGLALYVGGAFTQIALVSRPRLGAINLATQQLTAWAPAPDDVVYALALFGTSSVYAGGAFTQVGGLTRHNLALLRPGTNSVASWAPEPDGTVNALAASGSTLYAGGAFTSLGGVPQAHFGCLIPTAFVDVTPSVPASVFALRLSPNPTSGRVRIDYDLPEAAHVSIAVYDLLGRRVGVPIELQQPAGARSATWGGSPARGISPGIYFLHFAAGARRAVRRLVIL